MAILLRETEWARSVVKTPRLGNKPFETLSRIARYYLDLGYDANSTRNKLDEFLLRCDSDISLVRWSDTLDGALKMAQKRPAVNIDYIGISQTELDTIAKIGSVQTRRLAFTLLCLAKYHMAVDSVCDYWVTDTDTETMKMANIKTSIKRQSAMYYDLRELGLIQYAKRVDNLSVRVCFADDNEPVLKITDMRNLGYQYLQFCGAECAQCEECGVVIGLKAVSKGRPKKYCADCAKEVKARQLAEAMRRYRENVTNL